MFSSCLNANTTRLVPGSQAAATRHLRPLTDPLTKKKAAATDRLFIIQTGLSLESGDKPFLGGEGGDQQ